MTKEQRQQALASARQKRWPNSTKPLVRVTLFIEAEQNDWLEQTALKSGKSKAELIREALQAFIVGT